MSELEYPAKHFSDRDLRIVVSSMRRIIEIADDYNPRRNRERSMREISDLASNMELRTAIRRLEIGHLL